jgi:hypothetical protein
LRIDSSGAVAAGQNAYDASGVHVRRVAGGTYAVKAELLN